MNAKQMKSSVTGRMDKKTFVCLDCETTGLDSEKNRLIEVAAVQFTFSGPLTTYESLIDPKCTIPAESTAIHHITCDMVAGKPIFSEIQKELLDVIGDHIIVGHGIQFDIDFVSNAAERAGRPCTIKKNPSIDTLRLARLYGESPTNSLEALAKHFNVPSDSKHRAMDDVLMNIEVFKHLSTKFSTVESLFDRLSRPIAMKKMPLGKHKGRSLKEIPDNYLRWMAQADFDQDLLFSVRSELKRRKSGNLFSQVGNPFGEL
jgi:DNA polymerase-3 subunit epsilon